ncbi:protein FAR-RED ELONGATED HYPOCOTYL 3-like [Apium graveolens]|uniref:protein FAR-RED ELONGATED HYPOCOTYL 3-like n=1 Tax=Apium graveolens TaxID=4045 RepID=UPI003D7BF38B
MLLDKFKVLHKTCESFYYAYDVDPEGHLMKLFWVDATARRNYVFYEDVVSFDAIFNTNRYNMIFAPFIGVDKHDRCVTFAACLLAKEDISHYTWAFQHFLKAMKRNPVLMATDQCPVMKAVVPEVFKAANEYPATKHRLCMWHIMQKFPITPGNRLCKKTDFMEKMKKFIWSSNIEPYEFE